MSDSTVYARLIDGLCDIGKAQPSESQYTRIDLAMEGTLFTLIPTLDARGTPDGVGYFADVGPLPIAHRDAAALSLLECNLFMVGRDAPAFCANPDTGHIVLAGVMPLDGLTPETALHAMSTLAQFAAEWRDTHLQEPQSRPGVGTGSPQRTSTFSA